MEEKNNKINKEIKELVIVRLESMPDTIKISFGSGEELTKKQLIEHVKEEDIFGKLIINMQVKYLESLKNL
ncbi:hypothetical protein J4404_01235 [Candidatus Woesearchaeota archaeon]|nr:hypothetical protein [Candidatus Woesearchaeota archaeon]